MNVSNRVVLAVLSLLVLFVKPAQADVLPLPFDDASPWPTPTAPLVAPAEPAMAATPAPLPKARAPVPAEVSQAFNLAGAEPAYADALQYSWPALDVPEAEILSAAATRLSELHFLKFNFSVKALVSDATEAFTGNFVRSYAAPFDSKLGNFRETISAQYPNISRPYSALTVRVGNGQEDAFWLYSPAVHQTRRLTASNRSDNLPGAGFSAEDMLVWSGSMDGVELRTWYEQKESLPFGDLAAAVPQARERGCKTVPPAGNSLFFIEREARILDLSAADPYSLYGRQIIHVDKQSGLPIYKTVFDRGGRLWKSVVGIYRGVSDDGRIVPALSSIIVSDFLAKKSAILSVSEFSYCFEGASPEESAELDPSRLGESLNAL